MIYKALKEVFHGDTKKIEAMFLEDISESTKGG